MNELRTRMHPPSLRHGDLYVRIGNAKKKLSAQQAVGYIGERWQV